MGNIEQLEERIAQLTELVKSGSEVIESMKTALIAAEKERDRLTKQQRESEPKFERVENKECYYSVSEKFCSEGKLTACRHYENYICVDNNYFNNNNYFKTKQRAEEVADKINVLLKLERLHDIYCPNYKSNWEAYSSKHYVKYGISEAKWYPYSGVSIEDVIQVYFPTKEIAQKVCDVLNNESTTN